MTDNGSPADANAASEPVEEFPSKLRVHALARFLGLTSRQVLAHLANLGVQTRSPQSSVDRELAQAVAARVRANVEADEPAAAPAAPEAAAEAPAAEVPPAEEPATEAPAAEEPAAEAPAADEPPTLFSAAATRYDEPVGSATEVDTSFGGQPLFLQPQAPAEKPRATRAPKKADQAEQPAKVEKTSAPSTDTPSEEAAEEARADVTDETTEATDTDTGDTDNDSDESGSGRSRRRRRGRRGRGRGRGDQGGDGESGDASDDDESDETGDGSADKASEADSSTTDSSTTEESADESTADGTTPEESESDESKTDETKADEPTTRRRRRRRSGADTSEEADGKGSEAEAGDSSKAADSGDDAESDDGEGDESGEDASGDGSSTRRRRRRRRRKGGGEPDEGSPDDPPNTVVHEREPRSKRARDEVQGITGSTRLEAKRQRRRDGRDAGRRRPPILTESEFLARREAVDRVMVVRERSANTSITDSDGHDHAAVEDYTQVAVLEDGVLVEHFVTTATSSSMVGNIYLGRVQNVLPGMEAAFVDIGRGRNGVLYAGEVNWDAAGLDGGSRKIEQALKPGDNVLVQVSKDPVGHKGARLTTQISLAGRYLVYVPGGSSTGISRKLPDVERKRLKQILAKLVPDEAGVIIRTASEGVSAEELGADIARLESQWKTIEESVAEAKKGGSSAPRALYEEPDLLVRVVRDLFNEDFKKLVVEGDKAWNLVEGYVSSVAPDLMARVEQFSKPHADAPDSFVVHRIDEQLAKALDRKVWLPSGGTLIIEHTEAMTVVDVNTGKFTGSGGNLEETVTRNNLEAAEEIVRQMRLRDIGGMIIVDFIDMVLESNRDLVLRRLTEALARDRTRHQVSEVTSLGLVQMTRKRLGTGLLEAFSTQCTACGGRGIIVHANPVEVRADDSARSDGAGSKRSRRGKKKSEAPAETKPAPQQPAHKPAAEHPLFRAMASHTHDDEHPEGEHVEAETVEVEQAVATAADNAATTETEKPEPAVTEPEPAAEPEPAKAEEPTGSTDGQAPAVAKRRRRVVRRPAQTTTAPENVVMTAVEVTPEAPKTTFGPVSTGESVVAVRRRPRKRTAGRPAGPPPADG
ncbi:translation initiation factor IF-2 N-terminal domain-containing protein [Gordonia westfalica]|uniref:Translation initiation factor IF-2 N-terminal domain-containing protein n=1 Tax=Gordonia westfalica TaxID=158898 RepID=A0ABU2GNZ0_9ACTN|nr:translation initiation factor IF-2 N-terminal domain-containing protein [Gordonia westfalica]MDS1112690.1 translation initiation factor IF-2 N-terminal domain-containing protein [Gordonia westfalica]